MCSDFNEDELEMLAESASESEGEKDDDDDGDDDDDDDVMNTSSDVKDSNTEDVAEHSSVTVKQQMNSIDDSDSDDVLMTLLKTFLCRIRRLMKVTNSFTCLLLLLVLSWYVVMLRSIYYISQ